MPKGYPSYCGEKKCGNCCQCSYVPNDSYFIFV